MEGQDGEVQAFLANLSTHDFSVSTEDLEKGYNCLQNKTDNFTNITEDTVATAISADRTVIQEVLRLSANFHSMDSWTALVGEELPLDNSSKPAVFNEIQHRVSNEPFKTEFYDFITDILGDDLLGNQDTFGHWDVVEEIPANIST